VDIQPLYARQQDSAGIADDLYDLDLQPWSKQRTISSYFGDGAVPWAPSFLWAK